MFVHVFLWNFVCDILSLYASLKYVYLLLTFVNHASENHHVARKYPVETLIFKKQVSYELYKWLTQVIYFTILLMLLTIVFDGCISQLIQR